LEIIVLSTTSTTASPADVERSLKVLNKLLMKTLVPRVMAEYISTFRLMPGRSWEIK